MVVHASEVGSGELQAIFQSLKREAHEQASLFFVVCIDEGADARDRTGKLAAIIDEAREQTNTTRDQLCVADLRMDRQRFEVTRGDQWIHLSPLEYKLLEALMLHQDRVLDVEFLTRSLLGGGSASQRSNILWVYIHRLRKKIDGPHCIPLIHTVRNRGYMLRSRAPRAAAS